MQYQPNLLRLGERRCMNEYYLLIFKYQLPIGLHTHCGPDVLHIPSYKGFFFSLNINAEMYVWNIHVGIDVR